ncbi:MAG: FAD-dependent oxidoreductase, partial [Fimbriimonadaceae bacterium]
VEIERPVYLHSYGRVEPGDPKKNANPRYTYRPGINTMAKLLAEGLEVRRETRIEEIAEVSSGVVLNGERFDAAISTAPVPQAEALMNQGRALPPTEYRPCLSVLLGFDQPFDAPYYALLDPEQDGPLTWLSVETLKSPGRAPQGHTAVVAQLSRRYSRNRYEAADEAIIRDTCVDVARLMGKEFSSPVVSDVKRWKYSQPDNTGSFERANPPGTRLVIASDGLAGGRLELAYDVGLRAADRVLAL